MACTVLVSSALTPPVFSRVSGTGTCERFVADEAMCVSPAGCEPACAMQQGVPTARWREAGQEVTCPSIKHRAHRRTRRACPNVSAETTVAADVRSGEGMLTNAKNVGAFHVHLRG